ncbi:unnamed protein product [Chondrus crispus]|uniref:Uncharacterized protein n=1 Tax=Chondrus crispus TaxID=2769 RepID=R7QI77_CHOCR|nr:unnamed protein product [Chondrus crispus]CDF37176.1 unnamed protein product [Chondrus crispus]|eukprot:XP_005716995.1 unnamed protein product [Chondrus crispus]
MLQIYGARGCWRSRHKIDGGLAIGVNGRRSAVADGRQGAVDCLQRRVPMLLSGATAHFFADSDLGSGSQTADETKERTLGSDSQGLRPREQNRTTEHRGTVRAAPQQREESWRTIRTPVTQSRKLDGAPADKGSA